MPAPTLLPDTICAIATSLGEAAIGVIRVSGVKAINAAEAVLRLRSGEPLSGLPDRRMSLADVVGADRQRDVDEVMVTVMRGPRSYTREDVVEISCHGGPHVLRCVLDSLIEEGIRLAQPGEFTRRAFLNGRIDLTQAEAVMDVIRSASEASSRAAIAQLRGGLSREIGSLRDRLLGLLVDLEAGIDFSEEDIEGLSRDSLVVESALALREIRRLLGTADRGRIVRDGAAVVIAGRPNVGKSSIINMLLREKRSIVTSIPGTTRDTITELADLGGLAVRLTDTAGVRPTDDPIEKEGICRTREAIDEADVILAVFDRSEDLTEEDRTLVGELKGKNVILLANKSDLNPRLDIEAVSRAFDGARVHQVSILSGLGMDEVVEAIVTRLGGRTTAGDGMVVTKLRHVHSLKRAEQALANVQETLQIQGPDECIALDLRGAVDALGEVLGAVTTDEILDEIFSKFCIGK